MIEAIINIFTDSLIPDEVIRWLRRRISYKNRIKKSKGISKDVFFRYLSDLPNTINDIKKEVEIYDAKALLLIAYPNVDEDRFWLCIGIDEKNKFLFELKFQVNNMLRLILKDHQTYHVFLQK